MKEDESVVDFFSRLVLLINQMKVCGESINDLQKIEKVSRSLPANLITLYCLLKSPRT